MNPKKVNLYQANERDLKTKRGLEYFKVNDLPKRVGDFVVLGINPNFRSIEKEMKHYDENKPPLYYVLAAVTEIEDRTFKCKPLEDTF
jgi:hypothetical protein